MFGLVLSIHNYSSCSLKRYRHKHDVLNSAFGGAVAGFIVSLPFVLTRRGYKSVQNWKQLGKNTALIGGLGCVLHLISNVWNPTLMKSNLLLSDVYSRQKAYIHS